jgi:uncharacterized glyoxalase superfamily protein PhnB
MRLFMQLNFGGNCAEAFRYYEQSLGGKMLAQNASPNEAK